MHLGILLSKKQLHEFYIKILSSIVYVEKCLLDLQDKQNYLTICAKFLLPSMHTGNTQAVESADVHSPP